ncbi:MAG: hypothetical protein LBC61_04145 [Candidatus Peribacteria bacterium]|nr:hypothetical protein [Candidatus Peribacteria bacterium]
MVVPSWEIVNNFPCYKLFNKKKNLVFKYLENYVRENSFLVVITHTRFFLTSLVGGLFARKNKVKWVHIEH